MPAPKTWPDDQGWNFAPLFGQKEPDLIIKSDTVHDAGAVAGRVGQARHADAGITEPRWVRAIEIRPTTVKGRKITHHAIAYLEQDEPGAPAVVGLPDAVHGMGRRQAGRNDASGHGQAAPARIEVPLGHPLLAGR